MLLALLLAAAHADCAADRTGVLVVDDPYGEDVVATVDGAPVEPGTPRTVPAGRHVVTVRSARQAGVTAEVEVPACGRVERLLDDASGAWTADGAAPEAPAFGTVRLSGDGVGRATLDGRPARSGEHRLPAGAVALGVTGSDGCTSSFGLAVNGGDVVEVVIAADGRWSARSIATGRDASIVVGGGASRAICVGGVAGGVLLPADPPPRRRRRDPTPLTTAAPRSPPGCPPGRARSMSARGPRRRRAGRSAPVGSRCSR